MIFSRYKYLFFCLSALIFCFLESSDANAQASLCGPTTPTFTVNLTGNPNGTYMSPSIQRNDTCCGSTPPDQCVQFIVTLDPAAVGLIFTVCNGAVPPGALYYQVNCGPPQPVGSGICLSPPYPVIVTFCKPGNNQNQYCIQSVAPPSVVSLSQNCQALMWTFGYLESSITWNSIFPGPFGAYNNYLSCQSGCDSTWVTPTQPYPPYIDYQVCGTVINGCNQNFCDTIRVVFPSPLTMSVTPTNVSCFGANNGGASVTTSGGIPNYTYSWSTIPPQTGPSVSNLTAGNYTVTVTDSAGCTFTNTFVISSPTGLTASPTAVTNVSCFGGNNGAATITATGGTGPYTYSWNPGGQTTTSVSGLPAGVYTITITDANGCIVNTLVQITQPPLLTSTLFPQTNVSCFGGSNGSAAVSTSGGTPPYTFLWSNNQTGYTATGLAAGNYSVIITDANGCTTTNSVSITQPPTALTATVSSTGLTCFGANDGTGSVSASGATPNYTYSWSTIPVETTQSVTGLYAGVYTVTVTDANGCTVTNTIVITSPTGLTVSSPSITNVACFGNSTGAATVSASGGNPGYTYLWNPTGQTSSTATGLAAGVYTITVTDNNGCIINTLVQITQPSAPLASTLTSQTNVLCFGGNNGSATVSTSGGTLNYSYLWSNNQTVSSATGLTAGNYSVLITDANGCTNSLTVTITQPTAPLTTTVSSTNVLCFGASTGSISVNAAGGTGSYTYIWNPIAPNAPSLSNLAAGNYSLTTADANGCTVTNTFSITQPPAIAITVSGNPSTCLGQNDTLTASVTGGVPAYLYTWSPSGGNNSTAIVSPTANTTYTVLITDANACTSSSTVSVTVNPQPVAAFSAPPVCLNNSTVFTNQSTGGTQWFWDFGEPSSGPNNNSTQQNPGHTYSSSGIFTVTLIATNSSGCSDTILQTIIVNPLPTVNFSPTTVCVGVTSQFTDLSTINSGSMVSWQWNFGDPASGPNNISNLQNPSHFYAASGIYNVLLTVTSDSGCQNSITLPVFVSPPPTANFLATNACFSSANYFTDATLGSSQWYWQFGDMTTSTLQNPTHVYAIPGTYVVTLIATSPYGCMDTITDTVTVYPLPNPNFLADTVCPGTATAFTDLSTVALGTITNWAWNFGDLSPIDSAQNPTHAFSSSGTYNVSLTVTSSDNCSNTFTVSVLVYPEPNAIFSASPQTLTDFSETVFLTNLSSSDVTQWFWSFGDSTFLSPNDPNPTHQYSDTGQFIITLVVVNQYGCRDTFELPITVREFSFYIPTAFSPNGNELNDFFFGVGLGILEYEMWIFDRWGNLIFHCDVNDLPQSQYCKWDGKVRGGPSDEIVQQDVYVWKVILLDMFKNERQYIGNVTVVK